MPAAPPDFATAPARVMALCDHFDARCHQENDMELAGLDEPLAA